MWQTSRDIKEAVMFQAFIFTIHNGVYLVPKPNPSVFVPISNRVTLLAQFLSSVVLDS